MHRDYITRSVGLSYLFLGGFYWLGVVSVDKQTITGLSITAFLFVLSDSLQIYSDKYPHGSMIFKGFQYLLTVLNTVAIMVMLIVPFIGSSPTGDPYDIIGTTLLLASLGITIYLIATKNEKNNKKRLEEYRQEVAEIATEEYRKNNTNMADLVMKTLGAQLTSMEELIDVYEKHFGDTTNVKELHILKAYYNKKYNDAKIDVTTLYLKDGHHEGAIYLSNLERDGYIIFAGNVIIEGGMRHEKYNNSIKSILWDHAHITKAGEEYLKENILI